MKGKDGQVKENQRFIDAMATEIETWQERVADARQRKRAARREESRAFWADRARMWSDHLMSLRRELAQMSGV